MKVTYEFDTSSEEYDRDEHEMHKQAFQMMIALAHIKEKLRDWLKYDSCPVIDKWSHFWDDLTKEEQEHYEKHKHYDLDKMTDEIYEIIDDAGVRMDLMGY